VKFRTLKFLWYRWRISSHAKANSFHHLKDRQQQSVIALLGPPPGGPTELATDRTTVDVTKERTELHDVGQRLSPYWWWPLSIPLAALLGFISWRADTRLFTLTGWPPADAMLLGLMLSVLALLVTWALVRAWQLPYDGTNRRAWRLAAVLAAYSFLVASILAIRIGQGDPNEPWYVRLGSAGLILAATIGPSFALELLLRRLFEIAPLLHRRRYLKKAINDGVVVRDVEHRASLAQRTDEWHHLASRLESVYEIEYEKYTMRQESHME
jgi:hypothetical protein